MTNPAEKPMTKRVMAACHELQRKDPDADNDDVTREVICELSNKEILVFLAENEEILDVDLTVTDYEIDSIASHIEAACREWLRIALDLE